MNGTEHPTGNTARTTIRNGVTLALVGRRDARSGATVPPPARTPRQASRVLTTVLFTDVVDSTGHALALGDERWLALLERHEGMVRAEIRRGGGRPVAAAGDGMVATFDGAAAAIQCATRVARLSPPLGLEVRCGLHCGEYERRGSRVGGIVFHVAARVVHLAAPGEVLVSETLKQLAAGSTLRFRARGRRTLRGLQGLWPIYGVIAAEGGDAAR
jgi:class 3 adenylate cyclase